ncbi:retrotransposon hot spot (RHS) protein, putative [Trypanosoma cruzi marinkellei]|uniref:Retrotransposon hot spot (RHS) protein, putative n=1 Tax=Trypanosoma cruzi marinkellei TaxID=85056 RepID=K2M3N2_TRYCR|nr:retrotransposon hot spot (RHS) protein, putative [Trypanosoma cruzi marinkellei]
MWRCCRLHIASLWGRWASTVSPPGVAVRLRGAPTAPPCECRAQRHWDCGKKQPRLPFGAIGTCWPPLGGASGMLHRTGVVMAPCSGSGDGSDAAARRVVAETRRPQWTLDSRVEDVLLDGDTLSTKMRLNDFLQNYFGGMAAVDEDHNVAMEFFGQEPYAYVQGQQLLEILNVTEYQVYKLHHKGVFSLEQWRKFERKDTVTPFARGKLNAALTQVQTQGMKLLIFNKIENVLLKGSVRVKEMKLNDFLTRELDGRGVVDTNRNVFLKEFFEDPARYIRNKRVLNKIQTSSYYARMDIAVKEEMIFEEDINKLYKNGVHTLLGWSKAAAAVKAGVHNFTKNSLDAALEELRRQTTEAPTKLEGLYESVYDSRWHHVVELPDGEKQKTGTGMEMKEGKPEQSWTYKKVGDILEKDDGAERSGAAPPRLMVLTSDKGWPYTLNAPQGPMKDFFINCEVDRVWQIVSSDLTKWFDNFDLSLNPSPMSCLLIGTPGIGKSMAAGSYLLYQLLHYDIDKIQVVVHCFGDTAYVFNKITQTVTKYEGEITSKIVVRSFWQRGMKGYIIYDVARKGTPPDTNFAPASGWGMIVVSSPKVGNYDEWEKQLTAKRIIMNCPAEMDVKAM